MQEAFSILLIEDNLADVLLIRETLKNCKMPLVVNDVNHGAEAMRYLRGEGPYSGKEMPDLILLDINLPGMNGQEVLQSIREDATLRHVPVVMLTSSAARHDVTKSYQLGANGYITKPVDLEQLAGIVDSIENFWFNVVTLPPKS